MPGAVQESTANAPQATFLTGHVRAQRTSALSAYASLTYIRVHTQAFYILNAFIYISNIHKQSHTFSLGYASDSR